MTDFKSDAAEQAERTVEDLHRVNKWDVLALAAILVGVVFLLAL